VKLSKLLYIGFKRQFFGNEQQFFGFQGSLPLSQTI